MINMTAMLFWTMMAVATWNLIYPWKQNQPEARRSIHAPLLLVPLWVIYESTISVADYIRVDYFILIPVFVITLIVYFLKVRSYEIRNNR